MVGLRDEPAFALAFTGCFLVGLRDEPAFALAFTGCALRRVKERWQSWFNAPDSKSDVLSKVPGVRIPLSPL